MIYEGCRMLCCEAGNLGTILVACYLRLKRDIKRRSLDYFGWTLSSIFNLMVNEQVVRNCEPGV